MSGVYVGLMSGTSLDGISAAVVRFTPDESHTGLEILHWGATPYTKLQRDRLTAALEGGTSSEYCRLAFDLGEWLAVAAQQAIAEAGIARSDIAAIGSHGHTIRHEPGHSTWQLGEAAVIAERTGIAVVSDFRVRDVAAGGQGAPLVPLADALLFAGDDWRALQNIGGMGNVTIVPPGGDLAGVRAFDTGPGVAIVDAVARTVAPELPYDVDGRLASSGTPVAAVVDELLAHPYFKAEPPKSTGRELFGASYAASLIERCRAVKPDVSPGDLVATATSLTARSIGDALRRFMPEPVTEMLVAGGGARNPALMAILARELAPVRVADFAERYFDAEAKEAVAFAFLAYRHMRGDPGNVPRATGARGPRILGKLTPA